MINVILIRNVSPNNLFGGIRKHCQSLYSLFQNDDKVTIAEIEQIAGGYVSVINKRFFHFTNLYKYIKCSDSDIVHIHGFASLDVVQTILVAKLLRKKIVYSPHFHPFECLKNPLLGKIYFYGCLRFLLPLTSTIVTISKTDTSFFKKFHKTVIRIPHRFEIDNRKHNVKKKRNMVLFVGRNEDNKGISHLYNLPKKYEVHCVTKGKLLRDDFILHSNVSDEKLSVLYSEAALVVIPSRYEAFSYVALEAFAHGTPVVMSNTVKIVDYLEGMKGYSTFQYSHYEDFVNAVEGTIGESVDIKAILSQFDGEVVKEMYKIMYINVLK